MDAKAELNALARQLYKAHGFQVDEGYDFSTATHPQQQFMWTLARVAKDFFVTQAKADAPAK